MNEFWENLIESKYSPRSTFFNLDIVELTKFKSGLYNQFFGYGTNYDYIVNVCYYSKSGQFFLGIGRGITEYEAENMSTFELNIIETVNDEDILSILTTHYKWNIHNYFNLCD
tara:strand:+ start:1555 stop:1893 length:339 start_codon:yes stop_codon:yes gene_type:complete